MSTTICDARPDAMVRTQTAGEWQAEVRAARRLSDEQIERAEQYRRAYAMKSGPGAERGRRTALTRARIAYTRGLFVDPGDAEARRGLQTVLTTLGPTTERDEADRRCAVAGGLFSAGLLPEARIAYAQALRSGRTTTCVRSGLRKLRWAHGWAAGKLRDATELQRAGATAQARPVYMDAFAADSSQTAARRALTAAPGPDPDRARAWSRVGSTVSDGWSGVAAATAAVQADPEAVAATVALLGLAFLLGTFVLQYLARIPVLRAGMDRVPPLRRFTRTRVPIQTFEPETSDHADVITRVFQHAVRQRPLTPSAAPDAGGSLELVQGVTGGTRTADVLLPLASLQRVAEVLTWLVNLVPREEMVVRGRLLEPSERGPGLSLHVLTRRGRPITWREFWHDDILSSAPDDEEQSYRDLARYAAAWFSHRALRPRIRGDWRPSGWFQVGVACQDSIRYVDALEAYAKVAGDTRFTRNPAMLHNVAVCRLRTGDYTGALESLDVLDEELGQRWTHPVRVKRPFSAGYNRALALQYQAMADERNAQDLYAQARDVSRALAIALLAASGDDAAHLAPPALMLHAGLLLSAVDPLEPGRDRDGADEPPAVVAAAEALATGGGPVPSRERLRAAITANTERSEEIVAYVRQSFGRDHRATYNLACFEARLAGRDEERRAALLKLAKADLADAMHDRKLAEWARNDPALRVPALADDDEWQALLGVPAANQAAPA